MLLLDLFEKDGFGQEIQCHARLNLGGNHQGFLAQVLLLWFSLLSHFI